ncbi:MAG TPA: hypothetical protein VFL57_04945 [Bryobacteraceae bacterium]|nr:hypothetical protein [Bryobacteraceae bacterium]
MGRTVIGTFDTWEHAERVVADLLNSGFRRDEVSLIANRERAPHIQPLESVGGSGPAVDAAGSAAIGGLAGFVAGIAALAIPGIGPIIAAGPLAAGLIGATVGAAAGGITGALRNHGVSEEEAEVYSEALRRGATLVAVNTSEEKMLHAEEIMNRHGAVDIEERAETWRQQGWTGTPRQAGRRLDLGADPGHIDFQHAEQVGRTRGGEGGAKAFIW